MREIKFRGKRVDSDEWVYGDLGQIESEAFIYDYDICDNGVSDVPQLSQIKWHINSATVGQFTGLLDKNGKEIYEGDLLQITRYPGENYYLEIAKSDDPPHNFICGYRKKPDADVRGISDGIFEILEEDLSDYEVVCNIYEHPNLLGGDQ